MIGAGITLTLPALFAVGLASSPHCLLMCAPLSLQASGGMPRATAWLHAGRLSSYSLLGLLAGGFGSVLLWLADRWHLAQFGRAAAAAILVILGLEQLARTHRLPACCRNTWSQNLQPRHSFARGLLWGLTPCVPLYSVLALCALSGSAFSGGALALAFGLGNSPLLIASSGLFRRWLLRRPGNQLDYAAGALSLASGLWLAIPLLTGSALIGAWCIAAP
jgi:sulfite exporter TauE/SafE